MITKGTQNTMEIRILIALLFISITCTSQESLQINAILMELNLKTKAVKTDLIRTKIRPDNPEETIVVIPEIVSETEDTFELNSYILLVDSSTGKIKHRYFESSETNDWYSDAMKLVDISIDTAAYLLTKSSRAFGVRVRYVGSSRPNPYEKETLSLFVQENDSLKQVLKNFTALESVGEWDTECTGEFTEEHKTLIIAKRRTNRYYNILVKSEISNTINFLDENNECISDVEMSKKNQILKYNNGVYK